MDSLKVAMVNSESGDTGHVDELRREADIATRLEDPNIFDLVGVAADSECFCLGYEIVSNFTFFNFSSHQTFC
jgi:hypothetical protein